MKNAIWIISMTLMLATTVPAFAYERAFTPEEAFRAGCERGGFSGTFEFLRNGRVGTLKFPATGAAFVIFQVEEDDPYRWMVNNREDYLKMDFERGTLEYLYDYRQERYECHGTFPVHFR